MNRFEISLIGGPQKQVFAAKDSESALAMFLQWNGIQRTKNEPTVSGPSDLQGDEITEKTMKDVGFPELDKKAPVTHRGQGAFADLQEKLKAAQGKNASLQKENAKLQKQLDELPKKLEAALKENEAIQKELDELTKPVETNTEAK